MNCSWNSLLIGSACSGCGYALRKDYATAPVRQCLADTPCPHLGPSTGESVLIYGCGCSSSKTNGIEVTVFECDLHQLCVTYSRGTLAEGSTVKRCLGCSDNPFNRNPAK